MCFVSNNRLEMTPTILISQIEPSRAHAHIPVAPGKSTPAHHL
jgi:hypothetical protein